MADITSIRSNALNARGKASRARNHASDQQLKTLASAVYELADCIRDLAAEVNRLESS
jgi:hypothetical protein